MKIDIPAISGWENASSTVDFSGAAQSTVGQMLAKGGLRSYEPATLACTAALLDSLNARIFFDVGANIGIYSLVFKAIFGDNLSVTAFEPLPWLAELARKIADQNGLQINIHELALSDMNGEATFYVSAQSDSSNSLNPTFRKAKEEIPVQLAKLDDQIAIDGIPQVLKVDTESTEPDVLKGALNLISSHRPWIICEVLAGRTEDRLQTIVDHFDYKTFQIAQGTIIEKESIVGDNTYKFRDWLFAPKDLSDDFIAKLALWNDAFYSA